MRRTLKNLWLQPYDLLELMPIVAATRLRADELGIRLWPGDNLGYFGTFEHLLRHDRSRTGHSGGCGGGILAIGIEAHGDVKGCSAMGSEGFTGGQRADEQHAGRLGQCPRVALQPRVPHR